MSLPAVGVVSNGTSSFAVPARSTYTVTVAGQAGVPRSGIGAVLLRVAITRATAGGYLTVFPSGHARPGTSNLNFATGDRLGATVLSKLGSGGAVDLYNAAARTVTVDVDALGYTLPGAASRPGTITGVDPSRVFDTAAHPVPAHGSVTFTVAGRGGVPTSGSGAGALTLTAAAEKAGGYLTAFPAGSTRPATSTLNFDAGRAVANFTTVRLGSGGRVTVYNGSSGTVRVIADLAGWSRSGAVSDPGGLASPVPARVLDTGSGATALASGRTITVQVSGRGGVPTTGVGAVAVNVTAAAPLSAGSLIAGGVALQHPATRTTAAGAVVRLDPDGTFTLTNSADSSVRAVVDVTGWVARRPPSAAAGAALTLPDSPFTDVSCAGSNFCLAVRSDGAAFSFDGTSWTAAGSTGLVGGGAFDGGPLVSCVSATRCVAVTRGGQSATFDGASWSAPVAITGTHSIIEKLSCTPAGYCIAYDEVGHELLRWDGTTWSKVQTADDFVTALSCAPDGFCMAITPSATFVSADGTSWTARQRDLQMLDFGADRVSCTSATFCLATETTTNGPDYAAVFDGSVWRVVKRDSLYYPQLACATQTRCLIVGDVGVRTAGGSLFNGTSFSTLPTFATGSDGSSIYLSCGAPDSCVALSSDGWSNTFDGTTWSAAAPVDPQVGRPAGVACASGRRCVVVTDHGWAVVYSDDGEIGRYDVMPREALLGVSCGSATLCVAITADGHATRFTLAGAVLGTQEVAPILNDISCAPGVAYCVAVDPTHGTAYTLAQSTWTGPVVVSTRVAPSTVSCTATSSCVALGQAQTYRLTGKGWSAGPAAPENAAGISCATATLCLSGYYVYDGNTWTRTALDGDGEAGCVPGGPCVAFDGPGLRTFENGLWSDPGVTSVLGDYVACSPEEFCTAVNPDRSIETASP